MIAVLDTDILFSALISPKGYPGIIYRAWLDDVFELATSEEQIRELRLASRAPKFVDILKPQHVGMTINCTRAAKMFFNVPRRHTAVDSTDSFLLDLAAASSANYLVTGDKQSGMLEMTRVGSARIMTPTDFCVLVLKVKR